MVEWGNFLLVLLVSVVAAGVTVTLFSLGLRFAGPETTKRRPLGIACFAACALVIVYGVYLVIPFFHQ